MATPRSRAGGAAASSSSAPPTTTAADPQTQAFERDLRQLAARARADSSRFGGPVGAALARSYLPAAALLALAAASAATSAWALTPAYGAVPARAAGPYVPGAEGEEGGWWWWWWWAARWCEGWTWHGVVVGLGMFMGWAGNVRLVEAWRAVAAKVEGKGARKGKAAGRAKGKNRAKKGDGPAEDKEKENPPPPHPEPLSPLEPHDLIAPLAVLAPLLQHHLTPLSSVLTARWGPLVTELVALLPLLTLAVARAASLLDAVDPDAALQTLLPARLPLRDSLPGLAAFAWFSWIEAVAADALTGRGQWVGALGGLVTRVPAQLALAALYALLAGPRLRARRWMAGVFAAGLLHAALVNPHVTAVPLSGYFTSGGVGLSWPVADWAANRTLSRVGAPAPAGAHHEATGPMAVLARRESRTGYVSVLENVGAGWRALRCDHSLLGGEWVRLRGAPEDALLAEPIYAVFVMLEAVRLVQTAGRPQDSEARALVIGLGVGTSPAALTMHGINTTVVEIDPAVAEFATRYFRIPHNFTTVVEDAVTYTRRAVEEGQTFDYIIHDVFTGGAEPIPLFTIEFILSLYDLLTPSGVVAINFAGDLVLPAAGIVIRTILAVFPSCRIFRELERDDAEVAELGRDFTNMIVFCTKSADGAGLTFREPTDADYLGTISRRFHMMPRFEVPAETFADTKGLGILTADDTKKLARYQVRGALGHWKVMRTVIPAKAWETW